MAINFPTSIDSPTTKTTSDDVEAAHINDVQSMAVALETKVGVDGSAVATSHDYKLAHEGIVQVVNTQTGAYTSGSTVMPFDDTIPQNTEGDQYMTLAITPKSATNKLKIDVVMFVTPSANNMVNAALFQDSTANALAAATGYYSTNLGLSAVIFTHYMTSGTTSETTFGVRAGCNSSGTMYFNGNSAARKFGGILASSITITEIKV